MIWVHTTSTSAAHLQAYHRISTDHQQRSCLCPTWQVFHTLIPFTLDHVLEISTLIMMYSGDEWRQYTSRVVRWTVNNCIHCNGTESDSRLGPLPSSTVDATCPACRYIANPAVASGHLLLTLASVALLFSVYAGAELAVSTPNLSCPVCQGPDTAPNPGQFNFFFLVR